MSDLTYGRDQLGDPAAATRLEWLVTNGIGGFASGTVSGVLTRRYHGLLVAALKPPVGRTLLLAKLAESLEVGGNWVDLDANRWASGSFSPAGYLHLESFRLDETVPQWTWAVGDTRLEKRVWMEHGENTTYVEYRLASASAPARLHLRALVDHRDAHATTTHGSWSARVEPASGGVCIEAWDGATPLWLFAPGAEVRAVNEWYRGFQLAIEAERGLDCIEDHLCAAEIVATLEPGDSIVITASTRHHAGRDAGTPLARAFALQRRRAHEKSLLDCWRRAQSRAARTAPDWVRRLVLAADQFVVERAIPGEPQGRSIIAGYPWFSDWGRDTMIALPGLALSTGRPELARTILSTFARFVDQGMLPNYFPDHGEPPTYNSADAALWFFQAVRSYVEATQDLKFLADVVPTLEDIGAWYERGTRYGIHMDPADSLLTASDEGTQLTWMDAKVDDWVVTPRRGKPVELNALWYNGLAAMVSFANRLKRPTEAHEQRLREVEMSFQRYWNAETACLYDVLDGPDGHDPAIRPNQIFALSLPASPLTLEQQRAVLRTCGQALLTSHGLRTLAPGDSRYHGRYAGDRRARDGAYHQGTAWLWLLPHYALAHYRVHGVREEALAFLEPLGQLLGAYGIGSLPEIADGDPPHAVRGCVAQAWSVGEALRAWHTITAGRMPSARTTAAPARTRARKRTRARAVVRAR
ncbi:MAG TPA: amylo-alpha-1,6-glucosidase [Terriglobales bacterium]|nr:amylo-alpha-1,6-glucosidase [Terriglobales bacterium]